MWLCRWIASSKTSRKAGRRIRTDRTPITTPLIITMPIFIPRVSCIKQRARKPNKVVSELPEREANEPFNALVIASSFVLEYLRSSLYRLTKKMA